MARPTTRPRLAALTPDQIADDVDARMDAALSKAIQRATLDASLEIVAHAGGAPRPVHVASLRRTRRSDLALTAADLCLYAQHGLCNALDWEDDSCAEDAATELVARLWARPVDALTGASSHVGPLDEALDGADLDDPLDLVLVAAWARVELSKGGPLTARQLGALAGLEHRHVRDLARSGELPLTGTRPATCPAEDARRWLGARGWSGCYGRTHSLKRSPTGLSLSAGCHSCERQRRPSVTSA